MNDEAEHALRRHRALADPSRARILAELVDGAPLDARELGRRVGLHVNTVRVHLATLADAGMVASESVPPQGRGRPRVVYRATAEEPEEGRRYRLLAEILTAFVARSGPGAAKRLEEFGEAWGHYMVDSPPPFATLADDEALARLIDLLASVGFEPALEEKGRQQRILMHPCPFLELARRHQEVVCPIHLGLIRGALGELGAKTTVTKLEPFVQPDLCIAYLATSR